MAGYASRLRQDVPYGVCGLKEVTLLLHPAASASVPAVSLRPPLMSPSIPFH
eukprot:SAG31_NODE_13607_length_857_cov_151.930079_1_plen_51_part_01